MTATSGEGSVEQVLAGQKRYALLHGDCMELLLGLPENSVDGSVTDPPYGLGAEPDPVKLLQAWLADEEYAPGKRGFMGRKWDKFVPSPRAFRALLRVLKPGAHACVFAGTRTFDLMGLSARLAGFEMRDYQEWVQSQGYRKSTELEDGIGTGLKPSHEPILLLRKPLDGTLAENYKKWGTGGLQIDRCRVQYASRADYDNLLDRVKRLKEQGGELGNSWKNSSDLSGANDPHPDGRWPPNLLLGHLPGCLHVGERSIAAHPTWDTPNRATAPSWFTGAAVSPVQHGSIGRHPDSPDHLQDCNFVGHHRGTRNGRPDQLGLELALADLKYWQCADGCTARSTVQKVLAEPRTGRDGEPSAERRYDEEGATSFAMKPGRRITEEIVDAWCCEPGCPVREIGEQTGVLRSGSMRAGTKRSARTGNVYGQFSESATEEDIDGDEGPGGRFYPQFQATELDVTLHYFPKVGARERNIGLENFREVEGGKQTGRKEGSRGVRNARAGAGRTGKSKNPQPTVKPYKLIQYLMRLVTPPGGVCLDQYMGSGTGGVAAVCEGLRFIGIELQDSVDGEHYEPFYTIARARILAADGLPPLVPPPAMRPVGAARHAARHPFDVVSGGAEDVEP